MSSKRRQAREWAIQMLVAADLNPPGDKEAFIAGLWDLLASLEDEDGGPVAAKGDLRKFAEKRVNGVLDQVEAIDETLKGLIDNWELYRLGTVERVVLRMGVWEIGNTDIPAPVVINEAIDLVNWFSGPRSRRLVNGVLDKYAKGRTG